MSTFFTIAVVVLVFLIIFQITKASEYVAVLRGEDKTRKEHNRVNGFLMILFLIAGLIGVYLCHEALHGKTLFAYESPSVQGERVDAMINTTLIITGIVFIITQVILFVFAFRYQESDKRKAYYFPHNNTMEIIWTVVPAIALTVLIVVGLRNWFSFTSEPPKNALEVEVTGRQFGWIFRYPGKDRTFGKRYYQMIDEGSNTLGLIWSDTTIQKENRPPLNLRDDPATHDDIVQEQTMYVVKNRPVSLLIHSRDVLHDVGLPWFRLKMDAVPGTPTALWFTPKYTTKEMREKTGNAEFQYEISCDQMCGNGHYSMKGIIEVVTQLEFDEWMAKQKPYYYAAFPDKDPANQQQAIPAATDSAKTATAQVSNISKPKS